MAMETETMKQILSILTVILALKFFATNVFSGLKRKRAPEDEAMGITNDPKEDNASTPLIPLCGAHQGLSADTESGKMSGNTATPPPPVFDDEMRWKRIIMNDLENIPVTLALMWAAVVVQANNEAIVGLSAAFVFARVSHTICYVYALMPWRTIVWIVGFLSSLGLAILIPISTFEFI